MLRGWFKKLDELAEQKCDTYSYLSYHSKEEERKPYHADMAVLMVFARQRINQFIEETEGNDE